MQNDHNSQTGNMQLLVGREEKKGKLASDLDVYPYSVGLVRSKNPCLYHVITVVVPCHNPMSLLLNPCLSNIQSTLQIHDE